MSKKNSDLYNRILEACSSYNGDYGITATVPMQPIGGFVNNKVMPPTYIDSDKKEKGEKEKGEKEKGKHKYHIESRLSENGNTTEQVVILDSIQSAANRMEKAFLHELRDGRVESPNIDLLVMSRDLRMSVMELPHRIYDAYVRESTLNGEPFFASSAGQQLTDISQAKVRAAVFRLNPFALLFGCWGSTLGQKEKAFKFGRAVESEIVAGLACITQKSASRLDPCGIVGLPIKYDKDNPEKWDILEKTDDRKAGKGKKETEKISAVNLSNIPPTVKDGGVSVRWINHSFRLSFAALYPFVTGDDRKKDAACRAYLVALGLHAHNVRMMHAHLRSGCNIRPKAGSFTYSFDSVNPDEFTLTKDDSLALYATALEKVVAAKAIDPKVRIELTAGAKLERAIKLSSVATDDDDDN